MTSSSATITGVRFDAKTDAGVTGGTISAIAAGYNVSTISTIQEVPSDYFLDLNAAYPPNLVTLQNTGDVTVYIRNVVAGGG